jgi:CubicO group peptidase (beta-lactamase class C family)
MASLDLREITFRTDKWLTPYLAVGDFRGVVLIAQGDRILLEKCYGQADSLRSIPNTLDTRFRIASLSKTFTAAAIELLMKQGKLGLHDSLGRYVSGMANGDQITVEQLLAHASGVGVLDSPDLYQNCLPSAELLRRLREAKPLFAPGKGNQYSKEGYFLLALILEKVLGMPYEAFLRHNIFDSLKLENSGTACKDLPPGPNAAGHVPGAAANSAVQLPSNEAAEIGPGSIFSNAHDLYAWLRAVDTNPSFQVDRLAYPYGWGRRNYSGRTLIEQSGILEGFNAHIALYPAEHLYAVVLENVQTGFFNRIPKDLETVLFGGEPSRPPTVIPIKLSTQALEAFPGEYATDAIPYHQTLAVENGKLYMRWGTFPFLRALIPIRKDEFFFRYEYAKVHFGRNSSGKIISMSWQWPEGSSMAFRKL